MSSNPREAKSRNESSKSAGDLVCTSAVSAPSLLLISCSPLKAAAFQPASLTGPGVSNATRNLEESASGEFRPTRIQVFHLIFGLAKPHASTAAVYKAAL